MSEFKYDVFISYARSDYADEHKEVIPGNIISTIVSEFQKEGISYWFDEKGVYSGDAFAAVIAKAIKSSRVFLFISTERSNASPWTRKEIATANEYKRKIIPFRYDYSKYNDNVIIYIADLDYIDYPANPQKGISKLIGSIKNYVASEKESERQYEENLKKRKQEAEKKVELKKELEKIIVKIKEVSDQIIILEAQLNANKDILSTYKARKEEIMQQLVPHEEVIDAPTKESFFRKYRNIVICTSLIAFVSILCWEGKRFIDINSVEQETLSVDTVSQDTVETSIIVEDYKVDLLKMWPAGHKHAEEDVYHIYTYTYTGEIGNDSLPNGKGIAKYLDGRVCKGVFIDGLCTCDSAEFEYRNGDIYQGAIKNGVFTVGKYTFKENGMYFIGEFKDGEPANGEWYK